MSKPKIEFLLIDPQVDFCDPKGALAVPGADEDSKRLATCLSKMIDKIHDIHVTLDSHRLVDISHPIFWRDTKGNHPTPFTPMTDDVLSGKWIATNPAWAKRAIEYIKQLQVNNRYPHLIWPPHCLIGTRGHNVIESVAKALREWEEKFAVVDYVTKGSNIFTEHFSAVKADVPDPADPTTQLNTPLITTLGEADIIYASGQASSHCVAWTIKDIANNFGDENIKKIVFLEDTSSPVPTFEQAAEDFKKEMSARGMQIARSTDI